MLRCSPDSQGARRPGLWSAWSELGFARHVSEWSGVQADTNAPSVRKLSAAAALLHNTSSTSIPALRAAALSRVKGQSLRNAIRERSSYDVLMITMSEDKFWGMRSSPKRWESSKVSQRYLLLFDFTAENARKILPSVENQKRENSKSVVRFPNPLTVWSGGDPV